MREQPTLRFLVRTPLGVVLDRHDVLSVTAEDASGRFGARPRAEPLVAALEACLVTFRTKDDTGLVAVGPGLLHTGPDHVAIHVRSAVVCDRPDDVGEALAQALGERRQGEAAMHEAFQNLYRKLLITLADEERAR
ncbi:MAG: hypothetical protein IT378_07335 [Sandaracinaceae bacterium]|nr:hypothetical protein [Sandaracinaceae bacterium]